ncbi:PREDICTED: pentatricopeptide repeat-containing protein At2g17140 [Tarenaya hassleriana]|uniref:pentatricopeptide repeat-containing protein At2g17140 n=1 Tax=Tarenaya hassleriana TaxID=28532 RepID=UPI00053C1147|nr:PREDICTED: pentatricopeptide repeat-containing protein At2g17140 [Tarenaya hassleriana]
MENLQENLLFPFGPNPNRLPCCSADHLPYPRSRQNTRRNRPSSPSYALLRNPKGGFFFFFCLRRLNLRQIGSHRQGKRIFGTAVNVCGQKESLYSLMFNELLRTKKLYWREVFTWVWGAFSIRILLRALCQKVEVETSGILHKMIDNGCMLFGPAAFMPVIDGLGERGKKQEANELAEKMFGLKFPSTGKRSSTTK